MNAIEAYIDAEGYTCADINRAGTLVLVRDESKEDALETTTQELRPDDSAEVTLTDCEITTVYTMRHRNAPAGDIIGLVPADTTLSADAQTENWIRATFAGREGWSAVWLLTLGENCDYATAEMVDYGRDFLLSSVPSDR